MKLIPIEPKNDGNVNIENILKHNIKKVGTFYVNCVISVSYKKHSKKFKKIETPPNTIETPQKGLETPQKGLETPPKHHH